MGIKRKTIKLIEKRTHFSIHTGEFVFKQHHLLIKRNFSFRQKQNICLLFIRLNTQISVAGGSRPWMIISRSEAGRTSCTRLTGRIRHTGQAPRRPWGAWSGGWLTPAPRSSTTARTTTSVQWDSRTRPSSVLRPMRTLSYCCIILSLCLSLSVFLSLSLSIKWTMTYVFRLQSFCLLWMCKLSFFLSGVFIVNQRIAFGILV